MSSLAEKEATTGWLGAADAFWLLLSTSELLITKEVSEALRLKTAMAEVRKLLGEPLMEDEEIDENYVGPGPQDGEPEDLGIDMEAAMEAEDEPNTTSQPLPLPWAEAENREGQIRTSARRAHLLDDVPLGLKRMRRSHPYGVVHDQEMHIRKGQGEAA